MLRALLYASGICLALLGCGQDGQIELGTASEAGAGGDAGTAEAAAGTCTSSAQCIGERAFCELSSGRCVECLLPGHCESGKTCDSADFTCKTSCSGGGECTSGSDKYCEPGRGVCVQCRQDVDCTSGDDVCLTSIGNCVECRSDTDCMDAQKPFCPLARNECSECLVDGHCLGGKTCDRSDFQCRD